MSIKEIIVNIQKAGLLATICDQCAANRATMFKLSNEKDIERIDRYFFVGNHKIFTIFYPPHLLNSTRNALLKYNIQFENRKMAKIN